MTTTKHSSIAGSVATLTLAAGLVAGVTPAFAETASPLPQFDNPVTGSAAGFMSSPSTCEKLQGQAQSIAEDWKQAVADGDTYQADKLRVDYTNVAASWSQCMLAANKWLLNPFGS